MLSGGFGPRVLPGERKGTKQDAAKVRVIYNNGAYFVWDATTALYLREKFGIVGVLSGTLPRKPRQNKVHGLPLQLMKEEVVLLHIGGVIEVVEQVDLPSVKSEARYLEYLSSSYKDQNVFLQDSIYKKSQKFVDTPVDEPAHLNLKGEVDINNPPYHLQKIFFRQSDQFWEQKVRDFDLVQLTDAEKLRVVVLRDLRCRGYLVTSGSKFGGDFLVYPGDPLVYHAYFVVRVAARDHEMRATDILAFSRVASSVKKVAVIATVQGTDVSYVSLQWSGLT